MFKSPSGRPSVSFKTATNAKYRASPFRTGSVSLSFQLVRSVERIGIGRSNVAVGLQCQVLQFKCLVCIFPRVCLLVYIVFRKINDWTKQTEWTRRIHFCGRVGNGTNLKLLLDTCRFATYFPDRHRKVGRVSGTRP